MSEELIKIADETDMIVNGYHLSFSQIRLTSRVLRDNIPNNRSRHASGCYLV